MEIETSAIGWPPWLIPFWYLWIWRNHVNASMHEHVQLFRNQLVLKCKQSTCTGFHSHHAMSKESIAMKLGTLVHCAHMSTRCVSDVSFLPQDLDAVTAISALVIEGKLPILIARFISEQSRPSARPGGENGCACRSVQRPSDQASLNLCTMPGSLRGLTSRFFSLLAMKLFKIRLSESVLYLQKFAPRFFYLHEICW